VSPADREHVGLQHSSMFTIDTIGPSWVARGARSVNRLNVSPADREHVGLQHSSMFTIDTIGPSGVVLGVHVQ
jgi:hypothetical protein